MLWNQYHFSSFWWMKLIPTKLNTCHQISFSSRNHPLYSKWLPSPLNSSRVAKQLCYQNNTISARCCFQAIHCIKQVLMKMKAWETRLTEPGVTQTRQSRNRRNVVVTFIGLNCFSLCLYTPSGLWLNNMSHSAYKQCWIFRHLCSRIIQSRK